jgi:hypothetical protein
VASNIPFSDRGARQTATQTLQHGGVIADEVSEKLRLEMAAGVCFV